MQTLWLVCLISQIKSQPKYFRKHLRNVKLVINKIGSLKNEFQLVQWAADSFKAENQEHDQAELYW